MKVYNIADLIALDLGAQVSSRDNPLIAAVGVTAQQLLRNSPYRLAFLLVNLSTANLYVGPFNNPSASKGIQIGPGGGSLVVTFKEDFDWPSREWWIIADAAASNFYITEFALVKAEEGEDNAH